MDDSILFPKQATRGLESTDMVSRKTRKRGQKLPPPHVTKGHLQSSHPPTHTPGENGIVMNTVADNKETSWPPPFLPSLRNWGIHKTRGFGINYHESWGCRPQASRRAAINLPTQHLQSLTCCCGLWNQNCL